MPEDKRPLKVAVVGHTGGGITIARWLAGNVSVVTIKNEEIKKMGVIDKAKNLVKDLVLLPKQTLHSPYYNYNSRTERRKRERLNKKKKR